MKLDASSTPFNFKQFTIQVGYSMIKKSFLRQNKNILSGHALGLNVITGVT